MGAGAAALRGPLVVGVVLLAFVLGGVAAEADKGEPRVIRVRVIPESDFDRLVAALEANTAAHGPPTPTATSTAESLVDEVESGGVVVVPEAEASPPAPTSPPTITTTTSTTSTTAPPTTTTTDPVIRYEPHGP